MNKIVVFDLDETLGYFSELGMFWYAINSYITNKKIDYNLTQCDFNNILDLYPEFLRPNIINILLFLKQKRKANRCNKLMIYTNNQGPPGWVDHIKKYFEDKISYKLFDQIVAAFKINGKKIEMCRTSHAKSHSDFIKCTKIAETTKICFLDDTHYPDMENENVYYINIKPYTYDLDFDTIINRFLDSNLLNHMLTNKTDFYNFCKQFMKKYVYTYNAKSKAEQDIDIVLSKKIMTHLHDFFNKFHVSQKQNLTKKNIKRRHNKTIKSYI
jgi:hypothetical protein